MVTVIIIINNDVVIHVTRAKTQQHKIFKNLHYAPLTYSSIFLYLPTSIPKAHTYNCFYVFPEYKQRAVFLELIIEVSTPSYGEHFKVTT